MNRFSISSPTDSPLGNLEYSRPRRNSQSSSSSLSLYYRRIVNKQLDFEVALYSFFYLIVNPSRVYRNAYHQKQTKSRWARDDPSFYLLLAACMIGMFDCGDVINMTFLNSNQSNDKNSDCNLLWLGF